ncbi:hypothetical protein CB1_000817001 [Camelus ferus]|nr:hypothetical protein CB1_000817001 [Camelus ferus]
MDQALRAGALEGSRWALVAATVLAGVLLVSCLLCASCCCRRRGRHRKKPRDKKAVGLGRACGTTTTHLTCCPEAQGSEGATFPAAHVTSPCDVTQVQPDVDNVESGPGGPQQWGRLQLSLEYDFGSQEIKVGLRQAADLRPGGPRATADPYARVSLSPLSGRSHETKVHRSTLCLVFDETCCFHHPDRPQCTQLQDGCGGECTCFSGRTGEEHGLSMASEASSVVLLAPGDHVVTLQLTDNETGPCSHTHHSDSSCT